MTTVLDAVSASPRGCSRYFANNAATSQRSGGAGSPDLSVEEPLNGAREARSKRFRLLDRLQAVTQLDRLSHCRRDPHGMSEWVAVVSRDGLASYDGLQTCGSVWACPVDSAKVRQARTLALASVVMAWLDGGGGLIFPTLTLAHVKSDSLAATLGHLYDGWRYVTGHRDYRALRADLGIDHVCKAVEITYGRNGWHPHLHGLMFTRRPLTADEHERVRRTLWTLWNRYAERQHLRVLAESRAVVAKRVEVTTDKGIAALAEYLFKVQDGYGIAAELVRADLKRGRSKTARVPFQIAEAAVTKGGRDLALWHEYEAATKGRRVLDWTKGSAAALGFAASDEDLASAALEGADLIADLTPAEWALVVRYRRRGYLLNQADRKGAQGVREAVEALRRRETHDLAASVRRGDGWPPARKPQAARVGAPGGAG